MRDDTVKILKRDEVKLAGTYKVEIGPIGAASAQADKRPGAAVVPRQVQVVEKHPDYAIIELICSCGGKNRIRCDYAKAGDAEQEPAALEQ